MRIGVVREIKAGERRVALTPPGARVLTAHGHQVLVESGAGRGSGFDDAAYRSAGAEIVRDAATVWGEADLVLKVKEPLEEEFGHFRPGLILFTYLHLAAAPALAKALLDHGVIAFGYETVQGPNGQGLPLLAPMSEIAGRLATQVGAQFLQGNAGGKGVLLGGVPGVPPAHVVIIGAGTVGSNAAQIAVGMGARVSVVDKNPEPLHRLDSVYRGRIETVLANTIALDDLVATADVVISSVLVPGGRAPRIVTEKAVQRMMPGSVIVDVAVDQGGSVETVDRVTTHENPTFVRHGVIHYAVSNMPAAVPRTSTLALTGATLPYVLRLASKGWRRVIAEDPDLAAGLQTCGGAVTHPVVAADLGLPYEEPAAFVRTA